MGCSDILQVISEEKDLFTLRDLYKDVKFAPHVYSFVNTTIKWKRKKPDEEYITIYGPQGWEEHGTFIAHLQWSCHDFFVATKKESCAKLYEALTKTKRFDLHTRPSLFYAIHAKYAPTVLKALEDLKVSVKSSNAYDIWWMPKEKALNLKIDCPSDVYLSEVTKDQIPMINEVWPNKYPGSEGYLSTFLEMNGAHGVHLKSNDALVSWIFKVHLGTMAALQTAEEHKGKGYGALVTKVMAKEIAAEGHDPLGTVNPSNVPSRNMFKKIGFEILGQVYYIHINA